MLLLAVGIHEVLIAITTTYFLNGGNPFGIVNFAKVLTIKFLQKQIITVGQREGAAFDKHD